MNFFIEIKLFFPSKFSWVRAQELGAMVNCILLMSLCFTILVQAIKRLITIEPVDRSKLKLYILVGVIGLAINILALIILGGLWGFFFLSFVCL
jgi:zinc transporter 1